MARSTGPAAGTLATLLADGALGSLGDRELLDRFAATRDGAAEDAFAVLVARHGPMVLGVCRRVLRDEHEAQDAAQAVFLVLARRAGAVRRRDSAAGWLYRVARRTATRARLAAVRRREVAWAAVPEAVAEADALEHAEARDGLYRELDRLPGRYRAAIVLCHLEGLTCEEAARRLRCAKRTVETRLHRGRARLRERLLRRGMAPSALLAAASADAGAVAPASWCRAASRASLAFVHAPSTAATLAPAAVHLAQGALKTMSIRRSATTLATLFLTGSLSLGTLWARNGAQEASKPPASKPAPAAKKSEPAELSHDDGKPAGRRSIAGGGHAVKFDAPDDSSTLVKVKVHGARYGAPRPPREDFVVYLCDEKFQKLAEFPFRYEKFERGEPKWVTLDLKPTKLPKTFYLGVDFDPTQTKGVYVSHDAKGSGSGRSVVGLPGEEPQPFDKGDWLIRAVVKPGD
ncbi:MAG: hypothetical protein BGO49_00985 [Planctomycetales bacterium 71-10]|nr:MAG: hypothetical protein BGO49_00985 [Planctomycetales bacterium 71-10]